MRSVPAEVTLPGWDNHRVTQGIIDPDYWNFRHREGDGIFEWISAESAEDILEVTVGSDAAGRMERFHLQTTNADGEGLTFNVMLDEEPKPPFDAQ